VKTLQICLKTAIMVPSFPYARLLRSLQVLVLRAGQIKPKSILLMMIPFVIAPYLLVT
jgi:hypothetical protein